MSRMFVPGPVDVAEEVLQAQIRAMLPHRSREFEEMFRRASEKSQRVFYTNSRVFLTASSGTGLQEVTCRIHNMGGGISQALGTGGRDLKEEIGGITMLQGLAAVAADVRTRVVVLVSKPPSPGIPRQIEAAAAAAAKPVVVHFLGATPEGLPQGLHAATSLRHAR